MKIALIVHVYPPEYAPAGVMVSELAEDLVAAGHSVTVITGWPNHPQGVLYTGWRARFRSIEHHVGGYRVLRCGHSIHPRNRIFWRIWYYLTFGVSTLINGLSAGPFDAVLSLSTPIFGSWSSWLLARCKRARFVFDIFDLHPETARNAGLIEENSVYRFLKWEDTVLCRKSCAIATLSQVMKSNIMDRGIEGEKITVVPFWIDEDKVRPVDHDNPWRRANGIPTDKFVALYAGTIGYISGAEILAEAARLLTAREDILILVVGEGVAKIAVESRARGLGLKNIRFLPFQPAEVLSQVQSTADVGLVSLLPEAGETSVPSKVLGYLAAGRPVIASVRQDSATARMICKGDCGWVVSPQDPAALADAIRHAADNNETTVRLGQNARKYMLASYSRKKCTGMYEAILVGRNIVNTG